MLTHLVIIRSLILVLYFIIFVLLVIGQGICVISTTDWKDVSTPAPKTYNDAYHDGYNDCFYNRPRRLYARQKRDSNGDRSSTKDATMIPRCDSELRVPLIIWHKSGFAVGQYLALLLLIIMFISAVNPLRGALDGKKYKGCARVFFCVLSIILTGGEVVISLKTPFSLTDTLWFRGELVGPSYSAYKGATSAYVESWMVAAFLFFVVSILQAVDYYNERNPQDASNECCDSLAAACSCCGDCDDQWEQAQKRNMQYQLKMDHDIMGPRKRGPQQKKSVQQPPMIGQPPVSTTDQPQIVVTPQQQPSTSVVNKSKIFPSMPKSDSERSKKGSNSSLRPKSQQPTAGGTNPIAKMV